MATGAADGCEDFRIDGHRLRARLRWRQRLWWRRRHGRAHLDGFAEGTERQLLIQHDGLSAPHGDSGHAPALEPRQFKRHDVDAGRQRGRDIPARIVGHDRGWRRGGARRRDRDARQRATGHIGDHTNDPRGLGLRVRSSRDKRQDECEEGDAELHVSMHRGELPFCIGCCPPEPYPGSEGEVDEIQGRLAAQDEDQREHHAAQGRLGRHS